MARPFVLVFAAGADDVYHQVALKFAATYPIAFLCPPGHNLGSAVSAAYEVGGEATIFETDLSSVEFLKTSIAAVVAQLGKQCAAAIFQVREETADTKVPFLEQTRTQFRAATASQIECAYAFSQAALPLLTTATGTGDFPATLTFVGPTGDSREEKVVDNALVALSRSLGREYGKKSIHVAHLKFKHSAVDKAELQEPEQRSVRVAETLCPAGGSIAEAIATLTVTRNG